MRDPARIRRALNLRPELKQLLSVAHLFAQLFRYSWAEQLDKVEAAGMPGSMRQRGENSWNLRVYAGRDAVTGRKISVERTVRGNKREASKVLAAMVAEVDRRPVTSAGKGTVAELCREWLDFARPSFSPKTVETTRMYIEDPIVPLLGSPHVAKLTPSDLDRFYRQLLEVGRSRGPYAPATIRRVHGIIRRALTQAVRWGWITHNPAIDASPPRVPMKELKPPNPDQVVRVFRLAEEVDPGLATFIMLAASSGARRGELLALRWHDLDLSRGRLSIERGIVKVDGDLVEQGTNLRLIRAGESHSTPQQLVP
jgi:integrase